MTLQGKDLEILIDLTLKIWELYKRFKQVSFYHYACNDDNSEIRIKKIVEQINLDKLNKVVLITEIKKICMNILIERFLLRNIYLMLKNFLRQIIVWQL